MSAKPALAKVKISPGRAYADVIATLSDEFGWTSADACMAEDVTEIENEPLEESDCSTYHED